MGKKNKKKVPVNMVEVDKDGNPVEAEKQPSLEEMKQARLQQFHVSLARLMAAFPDLKLVAVTTIRDGVAKNSIEVEFK